MAELGEPPSKVTKFEIGGQYLEGEVLEEGNEEWLSEGVLTDDDQHNVSATDQVTQDTIGSLDSTDQSQDIIEQMNQDMSNLSEHLSQDGHELSENLNECDLSQESQQISQDMSQDLNKSVNIEETLNNFENSQDNSQIEDLPGDLNTFLVRKTDVRKPTEKKESDIDEPAKQENDDGNDTDDLLRMLGDGDEKRKKQRIKKLKMKTEKQKADSSDDDENFFKGAKVTPLRVAKNALVRRPAAIAQPEDDVTDASSDEGKKQPQDNRPKVQVVRSNSNQQRNIVKHTVAVPHKPRVQPNQATKPSPLRQEPAKQNQQGTVLLKKQQTNDQDNNMKKTQATKATQLLKEPAKQIQQGTPILKKQQTNDEDNNMKKTQSQDNTKDSLRLMCPEEMDEEIYTDVETEDEDDSLYDELPSSDSDNSEEWFTLDIRAEKAGDYIPLLGDKALQLLTEEKQRVASKITALKQNLTALTETSKQQAEDLRKATLAVAELDTLLKAV